MDQTVPYTGTVSDNSPSFRFEIGNVKEASPSQAVRKALAEKRFADAVNLSLIALDQNTDDRSLLDESLRAWTAELASTETNFVHFDPALARYFLIQNRVEGLRKLTAAAVDEKNAKAMKILGLLFLQGRLLPCDEKSGVTWLQRAAEAGDRDAGFLFAEGIILGHFADSDIEKVDSIKMIRSAAAAGHSLSQELLGVMMLDGTVAGADKTEAFEWLKSSAEKGNPGAVFHRGLCHANGAGTVKNPEAAARNFQKAAELGDIRAMHQYGRCLAAGMGVRQSWSLACRWIKKSAMAGYPSARAWCRRRRLDFSQVDR